jgi:predicted nuclease of predicted toxin-antitoxin system
LRFLVDEQLPSALARWISAQGHVAEHVSDVGLAGKEDTAVWHFALREGATLLTNDEDFLNVSAQKPGCAVVWFTLGNTPNRILLQRMEQSFPQICEGLAKGETLLRVE